MADVKSPIHQLGTMMWGGWVQNILTQSRLILRISVWSQIRHLRPVPKLDVFPKGKGMILGIIHSCTPLGIDSAGKVVEHLLPQICLFLSMPHRRQSCMACQWQFHCADLILQFVDCLLVFMVLCWSLLAIMSCSLYSTTTLPIACWTLASWSLCTFNSSHYLLDAWDSAAWSAPVEKIEKKKSKNMQNY